MGPPAQLTWALLFICAALSSVCTARRWPADPLVTLTGGGLLGLACVLAGSAAHS
jgi:hypothetical protein